MDLVIVGVNEPDALKEGKSNILKTIDTRVSFHARNANRLPQKPYFLSS